MLPHAHTRYILVLLTAIWMVGCASTSPPPNLKPPAPDVVSLDAQNWNIFYSAGMPAHPSADPSGAWAFKFPAADGHVNYVQVPFNSTYPLHSIKVTFKIESDNPQYKVVDASDKSPATVHLFLEQQNDDLIDPNGRWWAFSSGYNLGSQDNSILTISVPLTPDIWSNVEGQHDTGAFNAALQNIGWVGLTFGGQSFWGHGVALIEGNAKYVLVDYQVD